MVTREVILIELSSRQLEIIKTIKAYAPITGDQIAEMLGVAKPTLRSDLSLLVMLGHIDAKPKVGYFLGKEDASENRLHLKLEELKVKEIQGIPVVVKDTSTIQDAVIALFVEDVGSLMVTDSSGALVGVVSRKDLLKLTLGNPNAPNMLISLLMTRQPNIITIGPEDSVIEAVRRLIHQQVDSLPVVITEANSGKERMEVVGRISKTTLTNLLLDLASAP